MPEFIAQFLMLLYAIFNPIVFLILLGVLFIYIVYRVIKHFKSFYHISLRFKLPRALVDGVLGLLLILLLYDFYGQIQPIDYGYDKRSLAISVIIDQLIEQSIELNGKDEIFGITAEEWNRPTCIRYKNSYRHKSCEYINGRATKDYYIYNNTKYYCPLHESSSLKECISVNPEMYIEVGLMQRLINHISYFLAKDRIFYNKIPLGGLLEIIDHPNISQSLMKVLSKPCSYIDRSSTDKYSLRTIRETEKTLKCNKIDKDKIKLYLYGNDQLGNRSIKSTLIINRED